MGTRTGRPDNYDPGLVIQDQRIYLGLTQDKAYELWEYTLISAGYTPTRSGSRWWGRLERNEVRKQLTNIELDAVCSTLKFPIRQRAALFAHFGLDPLSSRDEITKKLAEYIQERLYQILEVMTDLTTRAIISGPVKLETEDLEEIYEDAIRIIQRNRR
jgi:hypothetical protein